MYPDFLPELQKGRAKFTEIKHSLQQSKVTYALLYLAQLQVTALGEPSFLMDQLGQQHGWKTTRRDCRQIENWDRYENDV